MTARELGATRGRSSMDERNVIRLRSFSNGEEEEGPRSAGAASGGSPTNGAGRDAAKASAKAEYGRSATRCRPSQKKLPNEEPKPAITPEDEEAPKAVRLPQTTLKRRATRNPPRRRRARATSRRATPTTRTISRALDRSIRDRISRAGRARRGPGRSRKSTAAGHGSSRVCSSACSFRKLPRWSRGSV